MRLGEPADRSWGNGLVPFKMLSKIAKYFPLPIRDWSRYPGNKKTYNEQKEMRHTHNDDSRIVW